MFLNKKILFVSLLTALPLLAHIPTYTESIIFASPFLIIAFCIFAAIASIIFIATSQLEWILFKNYNIYKNWKQVYRKNLTGLWALLFYFFYLIFLIMPLGSGFDQMMANRLFVTFAVLSLPLAIIFIIIRLRHIKLLPGNNSVKLCIILFSTIDAIILSLIPFFAYLALP